MMWRILYMWYSDIDSQFVDFYFWVFELPQIVILLCIITSSSSLAFPGGLNAQEYGLLISSPFTQIPLSPWV